MKQFSFFFTILITLNISCLHHEKIDEVNNFIQSYEKGPFDENIINVFNLDTLDENLILFMFYQNAIQFEGYSGLILSQVYKESALFDSIVTSLRSMSYFQSSIKDSSNYFFVNKSTFKDLSDRKLIPIPDLSHKSQKLQNMVENKEVVVLGLKRQYGFYFKESFIKELESKPELKRMISNVENGYFSGAMIDFNTQRILYWVMIW
jgi:hypothetical protein